MEFWYSVAERLIAHVLCVGVLLLIYCVYWIIYRIREKFSNNR